MGGISPTIKCRRRSLPRGSHNESPDTQFGDLSASSFGLSVQLSHAHWRKHVIIAGKVIRSLSLRRNKIHSCQILNRNVRATVFNTVIAEYRTPRRISNTGGFSKIFCGLFEKFCITCPWIQMYIAHTVSTRMQNFSYKPQYIFQKPLFEIRLDHSSTDLPMTEN